MQTVSSQLETAFRAAITAAFGIDADPLIGVAQNEKFGDYQSNAAMGLAKVVAERTGRKANPRSIADLICTQIPPGDVFDTSVAGPGFINILLKPTFLSAHLAAAG